MAISSNSDPSQSSDPIASIAKGATIGTLDWTKEQIKAAIERIKNHEFAFIEDRETINEVKEEAHTEEFKLYSTYIRDKELKKLARLGLTLRKYNNADAPAKVKNLRYAIVKRFGGDGLRVAEFISSKRLSRYIASIVTSGDISTIDMSKRVEELLKKIDRFAIFVKSDDDVNKRFDQIKAILYANNPEIFILTGTRTARQTVSELKHRINTEMYGYTTESFDDGIENVIFIKRKQA